jgi:hypothetical protein
VCGADRVSFGKAAFSLADFVIYISGDAGLAGSEQLPNRNSPSNLFSWVQGMNLLGVCKLSAYRSHATRLVTTNKSTSPIT